MASPGGYQGIVLPSVFGNPGDALDQQIALKERKSERDAVLAQQSYEQTLKQQQGYNSANLKNLQEHQKDLSIPLGNNYANKVTDDEVKKLYDELNTPDNLNLPPAQFDALINQKVGDLANWEKNFKDDLTLATKYTDELLSKNTNLDFQKTKDAAKSQLESKYFDVDESGNRLRKHSDAINTNQNPVAIFNDPNFHGYLAKEGLGLVRDELNKDKMQDADFSKYASDKGFVNSNSYDIKYNPKITELSHDEHGNPILKPKTDDLHLGNGVYLHMIPEETFDELMSKPNVASGINKDWGAVELKIENDAAKKGIDIDPNSIKMLKRDWLEKQIQDNHFDLSYIQPKEKQVVPKISNVTNINTGDGTNINDVYKSIIDKVEANNAQGHGTRFNSLDDQEQAVVKKAIEGSGGTFTTNADYILAKDPSSGKTKVYKAVEIKDANGNVSFRIDPTTEITTLSFIGTNLGKQADVKGKREVIIQGKDNSPKKPKLFD